MEVNPQSQGDSVNLIAGQSLLRIQSGLESLRTAGIEVVPIHRHLAEEFAPALAHRYSDRGATGSLARSRKNTIQKFEQLSINLP